MKKQDEQDLTVEDRFRIYAKKINNRVKRKDIIEDMAELRSHANISFNQSLQCLEFLTKTLSTDKIGLYQKGYDERLTEAAGDFLHQLPILNAEQPNEPQINPYLDSKVFEPNNINLYWQRAEMIVNAIDTTVPAEQKMERLKNFSECLRAVAGNGPDYAPAYEGKFLKVTDKIYGHSPSVLLLPDNPQEAVAALNNDRPRILFAEYDEQESAETVVKELYGTDGAYANHYRTFMDCRKRYLHQKHLQFN